MTDETSKKEIAFASVKRLQDLIRHKRNVQDAAELLGMRLIEQGEFEFAKKLIANSFLHDHSKFFGIEWDLLHREVDSDERKYALHQHIHTNEHHPEHWGDINEMPRIAVAEMVVDWKARSTEMGTDLRAWVKDSALPKYGISPKGKKYKEIKYFLDLLLDDPF